MKTTGTAKDGDGKIVSVRVGRSARKHKIGNARVLEALQDAGDPFATDGDALVYVGPDPGTMRMLKLVAIPDDRWITDLTVIHCSPLEWPNDQEAADE